MFHHNTLFLKIEAREAIEKLDSNLLILIDSDDDIHTGYRYLIGVDLLIQGDGNAFTLETGTSWKPHQLGKVYVNQGVEQKNLVEFAIPEKVVGSLSRKFRILLWASASLEDRSHDLYGQYVINRDNRSSSPGELPPIVISAIIALIVICLIMIFAWGIHKRPKRE